MHLLTAQTVLDVVAGQPQVAAWMTTIPQVHISAIAFVRAEQTIESIGRNDPRHAALANAFATLRGAVNAFGRIEPFDGSAALTWAKLLNFSPTLEIDNVAGREPLDDLAKMDVAIAIDRRLILVERPQPYHALISQSFLFGTFSPY
jgi:hypothetical protein